MKKILLLMAIVVISSTSFAQTKLPSKMTRGITVQTDDFNNAIKYSSAATGLTVLSKSDGCLFTWELICSDGVPFSFNRVQVLVNGVVENIPFDASQYSEFSEVARVARGTYSGGGMAVTYVNEDVYFAKISVDASLHLPLLENIVAEKKDTKLRFCGNKDFDGLFDKRKKREMESMIAIYRHLSTAQQVHIGQ